MKRRLVIDCLAFEYGKAFGYQEYVLNLLDYLYNHIDLILYDEIIIVCIASQQSCFDKYADRIFIKSYHCNSIFKRLILQTWMPFNLSLNKRDLLLYTANYSSLVKKATHVLVIHDLLFKRKSLFPYKLMGYQRRFYLPLSIMGADRIVAISRFTKADIEYYYKKLCRNKIVVIYNFFNFKKYSSVTNSAEKKKWFISVCSNAVHKNTITVLKAFYRYCMTDGTYDLILVGALKGKTAASSYYEQMPDTIKRRIIIYDKISNALLAELYQKSMAYISASLFEGLGMPIVEAMYFNLPVILSDYPVFHEVSLDKGIYFNPLDENDLVKKMLYVQKKSISASYKQQVLELYSEQNTSLRYIDLFNELYSETK